MSSIVLPFTEAVVAVMTSLPTKITYDPGVAVVILNGSLIVRVTLSPATDIDVNVGLTTSGPCCEPFTTGASTSANASLPAKSCIAKFAWLVVAAGAT